MPKLWTTRIIDAPPEAVWALLVDTRRWPAWGPTVQAVEADPPIIAAGNRGRVRTSVGFWLPFEITALADDGPLRSWSWKVAGIPATSHRVEDIDAGRRCRVGFAVPVVATPYLAVCAAALRRLERLTTGP